MAQVLGDTHTYQANDNHEIEVEKQGGGGFFSGIFGGSDEDSGQVTLNVNSGTLSESGFLGDNQDIFYPGKESDIEQAANYDAQFRTEQQEYQFDDFIDAYDLGGSIELVGRQGDSKTLLDTDSQEFDGNFLSSWNEVEDALENDRVGDTQDDREYVDGENAKLLGKLITTAGPEKFRDYNDLTNKVTVQVPELFIREEAEYKNDITGETYQGQEQSSQGQEEQQSQGQQEQQSGQGQQDQQQDQQQQEQSEQSQQQDTAQQQEQQDQDQQEQGGDQQQPQQTEQQGDQQGGQQQEAQADAGTQVQSETGQMQDIESYQQDQQYSRGQELMRVMAERGAPEAAYIMDVFEDEGLSMNAMEDLTRDDVEQAVKEYYQDESGYGEFHAEDLASHKAEDIYQLLQGVSQLEDGKYQQRQEPLGGQKQLVQLMADMSAPEAAYIMESVQDEGMSLSELDQLSQGDVESRLTEYYTQEEGRTQFHAEDLAAKNTEQNYKLLQGISRLEPYAGET